jgi:hypothetical protein
VSAGGRSPGELGKVTAVCYLTYKHFSSARGGCSLPGESDPFELCLLLFW